MLGASNVPADVLAHPNYVGARSWLRVIARYGATPRFIDYAVDWDIVREELAGRARPGVSIGDLSYGVNSGAKNSVDHNYLPAAEATGNVTIKPMHEVFEIRTRSRRAGFVVRPGRSMTGTAPFGWSAPRPITCSWPLAPSTRHRCSCRTGHADCCRICHPGSVTVSAPTVTSSSCVPPCAIPTAPCREVRDMRGSGRTVFPAVRWRSSTRPVPSRRHSAAWPPPISFRYTPTSAAPSISTTPPVAPGSPIHIAPAVAHSTGARSPSPVTPRANRDTTWIPAQRDSAVRPRLWVRFGEHLPRSRRSGRG